MNIALQTKWLWLQRIDHSRPWVEFKLNIPEEARGLFRAAARMTIGDGRTALFWDNRWLTGYRIQELAPAVYDRISKRTRQSRTVADALTDSTWARDIGPDMDEQALAQFLGLWPQVESVTLLDHTPDKLTWSWEKDRVFSARSAYAAR